MTGLFQLGLDSTGQCAKFMDISENEDVDSNGETEDISTGCDDETILAKEACEDQGHVWTDITYVHKSIRVLHACMYNAYVHTIIHTYINTHAYTHPCMIESSNLQWCAELMPMLLVTVSNFPFNPHFLLLLFYSSTLLLFDFFFSPGISYSYYDNNETESMLGGFLQDDAAGPLKYCSMVEHERTGFIRTEEIFKIFTSIFERKAVKLATSCTVTGLTSNPAPGYRITVAAETSDNAVGSEACSIAAEGVTYDRVVMAASLGSLPLFKAQAAGAKEPVDTDLEYVFVVFYLWVLSRNRESVRALKVVSVQPTSLTLAWTQLVCTILLMKTWFQTTSKTSNIQPGI